MVWKKSGKPVFNLDVELIYKEYDDVLDSLGLDAVDKVLIIGTAAYVAKQQFGRLRCVTDKGVLLKKGKKGLESRKAYLDISKNLPGLITLNKMLTRELSLGKDKSGKTVIPRPPVVICYDDDGSSDSILMDKSSVYLENVREIYSL